MATRLKKGQSGVVWRHSWRAQRADYPHWVDRRVREAFQLILRRVELCNANILPNTGRDGTERYVAPVLQLAELWMRWHRAACSWEPQSKIPQEQFRDLARHLLASYPVPRFFDSIFLDPGDARYAEWFAHVGSGRNIRSAPGMTARLTSRMAHCMLEAPESCSVVGALRWGQIAGLDGKPALAKAVIGSNLGRHLNSAEEEGFWLTFLQWLVNHPEFPRSQVGPAVDFLAARRWRDPDFAMKGRSTPALLRLMQEWHEELRRAPGVGFRALPRSGFTARWEKVADCGKRWLVEELTDTFALYEEGQAMHHCVYSYATAVLQGHCSIWSVKVQRSGQPERALTLEVRNGAKQIVQARGPRNRMPTGEERRVMYLWAQETGVQVRA